MLRSAVEIFIPGFKVRELVFRVPLDHGFGMGPATSGMISIFAKEVSKAQRPAVDASATSAPKPYLVYLQGGPGFPAPNAIDGGLPGWVHRAVKDYTVLLLDQRGTGLSTPVTLAALQTLPTPSEQAAYMSHFRADSIVEDCELIRAALGQPRWSLLGQSWGGFIITRYLAVSPQSLRDVLFTGGLPITAPPSGHGEAPLADHLYRALAQRVLQRNRDYYARYPADVAAVNEIVRVIRNTPGGVPLPRGGVLSVERFASVGIHFGFQGGLDKIHNLVASAFPTMPDGEASAAISDGFLRQFEAMEAWDTNPIYALLHESIYCDGGLPSDWSAHRVCSGIPEFSRCTGGDHTASAGGERFFFTGEMVFPWMFRDVAALQPLQACAELLAKHRWPRLYAAVDTEADREARAAIHAAALVYYDDMYVERNFSEATARAPFMPRDMPLWITNEYDHGGLRTDGTAVLERLLALAHGEVAPR